MPRYHSPHDRAAGANTGARKASAERLKMQQSDHEVVGMQSPSNPSFWNEMATLASAQHDPELESSATLPNRHLPSSCPELVMSPPCDNAHRNGCSTASAAPSQTSVGEPECGPHTALSDYSWQLGELMMWNNRNDQESIFHPAQSPWLLYLRTIENQWSDALCLKELLLKALQDYHCPRRGEPVVIPQDLNLPRVQVLDVDNDNEVIERALLTESQLRDDALRATTVNNFIDVFQTMDQEVQTRIVLLQTGDLEAEHYTSSVPRYRGLRLIVFCHIMGIELGMGIAEVARLIAIDLDPESMHYERLTARCSHVTELLAFKDTTDRNRTSLACRFLGLREVQGRQVEHVLICISNRFFRTTADLSHEAMSYYLADTAHGLRQAPRPCDVLGHGAMAVQSSLDCVKNLMEAILPMLRRSAQEIPHTETKRSKIFGLTVVIDLLRVQLSLVSEKFVSDASIVKKCERREQEKLLSRASSYHNHMLNHIHHIEAVKETAATSSLVLDTALCNLKSIAHDMQTEMEELRDHIETCVRRQNLHMTQQSIKESRSTVTLTVIAIIFVPLSLVSSIFGMNVQEINHTGPRIEVFIISVAVLLVISIFLLLGWRAYRNIRTLYYKSQIGPCLGTFSWREPLFYWWEVRVLVAALIEQMPNHEPQKSQHERWRTVLSFVPYLIGLRSLENASLDPA